MLLMAGLPGAGKSTLALALGRALGWPVIDKDIFDAVLRGVGITTPHPTPLAYDLAFPLLTDLLAEQRLSVILDCPATNAALVARAAQLAHAAGVRLTVILCVADQATRNARMARTVPQATRAWRSPARQRPSAVAGEGREQFEHLPAGTLVARTTRSQGEVVAELLGHISGPPATD